MHKRHPEYAVFSGPLLPQLLLFTCLGSRVGSTGFPLQLSIGGV